MVIGSYYQSQAFALDSMLSATVYNELSVISNSGERFITFVFTFEPLLVNQTKIILIYLKI